MKNSVRRLMSLRSGPVRMGEITRNPAPNEGQEKDGPTL
jgi:hypothetical protein